MLFDWLVFAVLFAGGVYVLASADRLAARPRRGTELRPSRRVWLAVGAASLVGALGALLNALG